MTAFQKLQHKTGILRIEVTLPMRQAARTVAAVMDAEAKAWVNETHTLEEAGKKLVQFGKDYHFAFALLMQLTRASDSHLKSSSHNIASSEGDRRAQFTFADNINLTIMERMEGLIREEAELLQKDNPDFFIPESYTELEKTAEGYHYRLESDSTEALRGAPDLTKCRLLRVMGAINRDVFQR